MDFIKSLDALQIVIFSLLPGLGFLAYRINRYYQKELALARLLEIGLSECRELIDKAHKSYHGIKNVHIKDIIFLGFKVAKKEKRKFYSLGLFGQGSLPDLAWRAEKKSDYANCIQELELQLDDIERNERKSEIRKNHAAQKELILLMIGALQLKLPDNEKIVKVANCYPPISKEEFSKALKPEAIKVFINLAKTGELKLIGENYYYSAKKRADVLRPSVIIWLDNMVDHVPFNGEFKRYIYSLAEYINYNKSETEKFHGQAKKIKGKIINDRMTVKSS